jgi:predicted amidohydrolase
MSLKLCTDAPMHRCAETQDGPFAQCIQSLAKEMGVAIAYGYPEREGEQVYNAFIFIDERGKKLAKYRKTTLPIGHEHEWFATGSRFSLLRFGGATIAMVICYECEFPEIVRSVALGGADVVLVATAGGKDWEQVPKFVIPSRAHENGVFMVYANYCGSVSAMVIQNSQGGTVNCLMRPWWPSKLT